jgi:hypothetical protein
MSTKNNPKNRSIATKGKVVNGKDVEPLMFYDFSKKTKYLSAKISKTNDVVCDGDNNPVRWKDLMSN